MDVFPLSQLQPQVVWKHFETLCKTPRMSKKEQQLRDALQAWATQRSLSSMVDRAGNLLIKKPATKGKSHVKTVILQAHIDMVTQANRDTVHDFSKDFIQPILEDGWLIAKNTTLGADNGIGVALALAVLESDDLEHGPIEVLLTVDEEAGMSGARGIDPALLKGQWLFNMDTEEWGELYLGCAGSQDVELTQKITAQAVPKDLVWFQLNIQGLKGGHSGVDIHLGRGNANVILVQCLQQYLGEGYIASLEGGTARNAIPREAYAVIGLKPQQYEAFQKNLITYKQQCLDQLKGIDDGLECILMPCQPPQNICPSDLIKSWMTALATCPYGIYTMSKVLDDVVETSNNIGMLSITPTEASAQIMVRSMVNAEAEQLAQHIKMHFIRHGAQATLTPLVSGWTPNPESAALACLQQAYQTTFGIDAKLKVIHAGLECGILAEHYPNLHMVSFGPDIRGAHAPGERVNVETVAKCWKLLTTALALVD
ncbi:aminoacyl-histidine dipeptidase [Acinetobacter sp. B5B]|uniref:aminoacyl-histidine dipeptidase n=1 Tax=Acinetobacter baretiae TaxID=2605383 RepID=UPI0018C2D36C|nr:aminoacyl-histidine dipeptidase [Acinetobacter baretiae]MBF7682908.1 aminoacyl-histidine dipeptidase [Acinetobacter baretiae]MBF7684874.1 aminoacyl-histidine dipeptidase [Acinetobacter baretiae]